jgi:hypothetical protein
MDEPFRAYEASGVLHYIDGSTIQCNVTIAQDHDGALGLRYSGLRPGQGPPAQWAQESFDRGYAVRFEGQTGNNEPVCLTGMFEPAGGHWNEIEGTRRVFRVISTKGGPSPILEVGTQSELGEGEWRFGIANLIFDTPTEVRPDGSRGHGPLALALGAHTVRVSRRIDYDAAKSDLDVRDTIRVTAEASVSGAMSFEDARELIADLCALLSIAQGTLIAWVFCDQVSGTGERLYSKHYPVVTRAHNGSLPLISPNGPTDLPMFLEAAFESFRAKREDWRLWGFSRAYSDIRTTGFLETRCLQAGCMIDFITGREAEKAGELTVLSESVFDAQLPRLRSALRGVLLLAFPLLSKNLANAMAQQASYWKYRTFEQKIDLAARRFGLVLRSDVLKPVIKTRNELVHRMRFQEEGKEWEEFARTLSVLDRLLMGLLGYHGPYVDPMTMTRIDSAASATS